MTSEGGFVYLILRKDGLWKLGHSTDVNVRRKQWEAEFGQPVQIRMTWAMSAKASVCVEATAHTFLDEYRVKGIRSKEVYDAPRSVILQAVEDAIGVIETKMPKGLYEPFPHPRLAPLPKPKPEPIRKARKVNKPVDPLYADPAIQVAIRDFEANPPVITDDRHRMGYIRVIPGVDAETQRRWMMSQGVHPWDQFVEGIVVDDAMKYAIASIYRNKADIFYLWSKSIIPLTYTLEDIQARGAEVRIGHDN